MGSRLRDSADCHLTIRGIFFMQEQTKSKLRTGDLVQVWDWYREDADHTDVLTLANHGDLGYLVKRLTDIEKADKSTIDNEIWEVIFFGQDPPIKSPVNSSWLHKINTSDDIKKKT